MTTSAREKCFEVNGRRCYFCRTQESVDVHFIDGNPQNDEYSNLLPVCERHHEAIHRGDGEYEEWGRQCSQRQPQVCR